MTHEEKVNYMRIAAGTAGFAIQNKHLDLLVSLYELITKKEGKTSLHDIVDVEYDVEKRIEEQQKEELKTERENKE